MRWLTEILSGIITVVVVLAILAVTGDLGNMQSAPLAPDTVYVTDTVYLYDWCVDSVIYIIDNDTFYDCHKYITFDTGQPIIIWGGDE